MKTYTATCRRSGAWWAISVPELKGLHTQARRLSEAEAMVRDALALFLDVAPDSFAVTLHPEVPEARCELAEALDARQAAREADQKSTTATAAAVQRLAALGITGRDAAQLLGLSPQRVSQIASSSPAIRKTTQPSTALRIERHRRKAAANREQAARRAQERKAAKAPSDSTAARSGT
ncbi:hypothetical protein Drose_36800 [Dactylosporangium roseum]|uniref:Type II toxin-antitoxin system HicB family antitoxin n=1 Tax=Dactylosporangium roseum TaxID=47989 RepID=A0ABY5Z705_9ACTN|nr:hypothetical protein [Dactylosporangium roseum]UWZ36513.1 hypothetical protein Drose_36800 [Dactylosporangium roseum]